MTTDVKIFARTIEQEALDQINALVNHPVSDGSKIRIMPDTHAGAGCTIGTTMTINDRVCPNLVGVDIGCGMYAVLLHTKSLDLDALDRIIHDYVPSGFSIHETPICNFDLKNLRCPTADHDRAQRSLGTLGGGNHFIEVGVDDKGFYWMVIHSGSRHLGLEVAKYYQNMAWEDMTKPSREEFDKIVQEYKEAGREKEISGAIKKLKAKYRNAGSKDLAYLTGDHMVDYLHDMEIVQEYAKKNRAVIASTILDHLGIKPLDSFSTIHNYIDTGSGILRKGAVSAERGEMLIIPMNMRDGSLVCLGKGNKDWNYSAPHGAGRLMSRKKARENITMEAYRLSMEGIHTTCINPDTLDESPFAYKDMQEIIDCIDDTCSVWFTIKPIYNFKASETVRGDQKEENHA